MVACALRRMHILSKGSDDAGSDICRAPRALPAVSWPAPARFALPQANPKQTAMQNAGMSTLPQTCTSHPIIPYTWRELTRGVSSARRMAASLQKMRCSLCKSSWRRCGRRACERSTWRGTTSRLASGCCLARTRRPCSGGPAPAFHTGVPATCCPRAQWLLGPPSQHGRMRRRGSRLRLYEPICRCRAGIYAARSCQDVALSHAKRPSFTISLTD